MSPLTETGERILRQMKARYGSKKGKSVFYASINAKKKGSSKWHLMGKKKAKRGKKK